jgi:hypothetical protein
MADQKRAETLKKIAANIILQTMGEQMAALVRSYLISHYNVALDENGDLSCSLYELRSALEKLVGADGAELLLQDVFLEIDALADTSENGAN